MFVKKWISTAGKSTRKDLQGKNYELERRSLANCYSGFRDHLSVMFIFLCKHNPQKTYFHSISVVFVVISAINS